jgi:[acyl-carrier-protein] S-malonyltransferase
MKNVAFMFPGQGSQSIGMLDDWGQHPEVKAVLQEANDILKQDLGKLIHEGSKEELALTTNTQPVMLLVGIIAYKVWLSEGGIKPLVAAGHSLGEYTALVASKALPLKQALPLVRLRAQFMQEAVPVGQGSMAAILGLPSARVDDICQSVTSEIAKNQQGDSLSGFKEVVEAVNFNDPTQTVIAGSKRAVDKACQSLKESGAKRCLILPVSAPFHSRLMYPAAEKLLKTLMEVEFSQPEFPVISNVDTQIPSSSPEIINSLYRQAFNPVHWVACVHTMVEKGAEMLVECGPGKVLTNLAKRIVPKVPSTALYDLKTLKTLQDIYE